MMCVRVRTRTNFPSCLVLFSLENKITHQSRNFGIDHLLFDDDFPKQREPQRQDMGLVMIMHVVLVHVHEALANHQDREPKIGPNLCDHAKKGRFVVVRSDLVSEEGLEVLLEACLNVRVEQLAVLVVHHVVCVPARSQAVPSRLG